MSTDSGEMKVVRAHTPWRELWIDLLLLAIGVLLPIISLVVDFRISKHDWFQRSGVVTVLVSAWVGYRSLAKHYRKFYLNAKLQREPLWTSRNQSCVDCAAFLLSLIGTAIWGYGDKLF